MNRATLRARVLEQLNAGQTTPVFWSPEEIDQYLDEAHEVFSEEVRAHRGTVYVPKRDGTASYDLLALAPRAMCPTRIWDTEQQRLLEPLTMRLLDRQEERWMNHTSTWTLAWFPLGWGRFGVYPACAQGGGVYRVDLLLWPPPLEDDADAPDLPDADQEALIAYAVYLGLAKERRGALALERYGQFAARWRDGQARADVRRVQSRGWQRERTGNRVHGW